MNKEKREKLLDIYIYNKILDGLKQNTPQYKKMASYIESIIHLS
jgi:hypothetical protein